MFQRRKIVHRVHLYIEQCKHPMNEVCRDDESKLLEYQFASLRSLPKVLHLLSKKKDFIRKIRRDSKVFVLLDRWKLIHLSGEYLHRSCRISHDYLSSNVMTRISNELSRPLVFHVTQYPWNKSSTNLNRHPKHWNNSHSMAFDFSILLTCNITFFHRRKNSMN